MDKYIESKLDNNKEKKDEGEPYVIPVAYAYRLAKACSLSRNFLPAYFLDREVVIHRESLLLLPR
jgi:hypothetical protein